MLDKLKTELTAANQALTDASTLLEATTEYKKVQQAKSAVEDLKNKIKDEEIKVANDKAEKVKVEIIEAGFELRSGHTTSATNHHGRTSENGEPYTYLIVHKKRPQIDHVSESSNNTYYTDINDNDFDADWVLGYGESEEDCWEDAIYTWKYEDYRIAALA